MKAIQILIIIAVLCSASAAAQTDTIYWTNGNISLLPELGRVWIMVKQGNTLKDVRIIEIKKDKGVLVYEKEKCLHDLQIGNIKRIQAGKNSLHSIFFYPDNAPYIKQEGLTDPLIDYKEFSFIKLNPPIPSEKQTELNPVKEKTEKETTPVHAEMPLVFNDSIIDVKGHVDVACVLEIGESGIRFKKQRIPNGPSYVYPLRGSSIRKNPIGITVDYSKK